MFGIADFLRITAYGKYNQLITFLLQIRGCFLVSELNCHNIV